MNELQTQESIFNTAYVNRNLSFQTLLAIAVSKEFITEEYADSIIDAYKEACIELSIKNDMSSDDYDFLDSINDNIKQYTLCLDDYIADSENIYLTFKKMLSSNPIQIIEEAIAYRKKMINEVYKKYKKLYDESKVLLLISKGYQNMLTYIESYINENETFLAYSLMNPDFSENPKSIKQLGRLIDCALIETRIINKFSTKSVNEIIKIIDDNTLYNNIAMVVLYNYTFNAFYKDGSSILISNKMAEIVRSDIINNMYELKDIAEIIETGEIQFSDEEKNYIFKHFLKEFETSVIKHKLIDVYIGTEKTTKK